MLRPPEPEILKPIIKNRKNFLILLLWADEFADLMSVARDQIENATPAWRNCRGSGHTFNFGYAASERGCGLAGVIKANLPARIFKVVFKADSRTVLIVMAPKFIRQRRYVIFAARKRRFTRIQGALVKDAKLSGQVEFAKSSGRTGL